MCAQAGVSVACRRWKLKTTNRTTNQVKESKRRQDGPRTVILKQLQLNTSEVVRDEHVAAEQGIKGHENVCSDDSRVHLESTQTFDDGK